MLRLAHSFIPTPLLSLRTGAQIGMAEAPIINPNNLHIDGWYCTSKFEKGRLILLPQDIREFSLQGFIINDQDALTPPEELYRLKDILQLNFELIGKTVVTNRERKVGKVNDFAVETKSMFIQKLYVDQSLLKSLNGGLSIDRTQIVEITNKKIVVREPEETIGLRHQILSQVPATEATYPAPANSRTNQPGSA